ncbi:MAG: mercury resistance system transport protein MerF [Acidobacteria bacterium]|nr:mercury resistance system transport protein MerF [Acidobacteriota bacterium]
MNTRMLLRTGIVGSVAAAICCFTPVLVILLGAVGVSAWAGWLDYVLMPALVVFIGLTVYAWKRQRDHAACCDAPRASGDADASGGRA